MLLDRGEDKELNICGFVMTITFEKEKDMTRHKRIGRRIWWGLLVLWILCMGMGLLLFFLSGFEFYVIAGTPAISLSYLYYFLFWIFDGHSPKWIPYLAASLTYLGLFFCTQWLFLSSKKNWKIKTKQTGRPMRKAVVGVAFAAMLLSLGIILSIFDLISDSFFDDEPCSIKGVVIISLPLILWAIWSVIFTVYFFQKDYLEWSGKIIKGLIGGSILELFVSIPILIAKEDNCYCAKGSYAGVVFGITVLLWAFGPGVYLLYLREKKRLENINSGENSQEVDREKGSK